MNKILFSILFYLWITPCIIGQKYFSKAGNVRFVSEAPIETIEANNQNGYVVFDASTGKVEFSVLIKGFTFQKALMQEHFNENYMESDLYPKAIFKGNITDWSGMHLIDDHIYQLKVEGQLTMHGVTKPFNCNASITMNPRMVKANAAFDIAIADYNIQIPKVVRDNISKTVRVTVKTDLQLMK